MWSPSFRDVYSKDRSSDSARHWTGEWWWERAYTRARPKWKIIDLSNGATSTTLTYISPLNIKPALMLQYRDLTVLRTHALRSPCAASRQAEVLAKSLQLGKQMLPFLETLMSYVSNGDYLWPQTLGGWCKCLQRIVFIEYRCGVAAMIEGEAVGEAHL